MSNLVMAIAGIIGAGKSTLVKEFVLDLDVQAISHRNYRCFRGKKIVIANNTVTKVILIARG